MIEEGVELGCSLLLVLAVACGEDAGTPWKNALVGGGTTRPGDSPFLASISRGYEFKEGREGILSVSSLT